MQRRHRPDVARRLVRGIQPCKNTALVDTGRVLATNEKRETILENFVSLQFNFFSTRKVDDPNSPRCRLDNSRVASSRRTSTWARARARARAEQRPAAPRVVVAQNASSSSSSSTRSSVSRGGPSSRASTAATSAETRSPTPTEYGRGHLAKPNPAPFRRCPQILRTREAPQHDAPEPLTDFKTFCNCGAARRAPGGGRPAPSLRSRAFPRTRARGRPLIDRSRARAAARGT